MFDCVKGHIHMLNILQIPLVPKHHLALHMMARSFARFPEELMGNLSYQWIRAFCARPDWEPDP